MHGAKIGREVKAVQRCISYPYHYAVRIAHRTAQGGTGHNYNMTSEERHAQRELRRKAEREKNRREKLSEYDDFARVADSQTLCIRPIGKREKA